VRSHALFRALFGAALFGSFLASPAPVMAAVNPPNPPQQALPAQAVQQFLANPKALLTQFPDGGPAMIAQVRALATSDPATLNALVGLLSSATPAQATAIGTALGDVAQAAVTGDPNFAAQVQVAIAVANNVSASSAFNAVIGGDLQLTAVTGGVGGGGGGGGGPTGPTGSAGFSSGPTSPTLTTATSTTPDSLTLPGLSAGSPGSVSP
jgi:hypothetical protein